MRTLKLKTPAKINLYLSIEGISSDGYHKIKSLMQTISLYDIITIEEIKSSAIRIECNTPGVPLDESNTVYKAVNYIKTNFNINKGLKINIEKNIPVCAGLAGGSSNAAGVIYGLNHIWKLKMSEEELQEICSKIGADVYFCLKGGLALAKGKGEILEKIEIDLDIFVIVVKPPFMISTSWCYNEFDNIKTTQIEKPDINELIEKLKNKDLKNINNYLYNDLEIPVSKHFYQINHLKTVLQEYGAFASLMTGSGSSIFGFFNDFETAKFALSKLLYEQDIEFVGIYNFVKNNPILF